MEANLFNMEEILIEEVKKRPFIYDKSIAVYKNKKAREQAWKEVAYAVRLKDREMVKKRWRSLRDSFIKIHRSFISSPHQIKIKWIYYKRLMFLIPHIEHKDIKSNEDFFIKEEDETTQEDALQDDEEKESCNDEFQCFSEDIFSETSNNSQIKTGSNIKKRKRNREDPLLSSVRETDSDEQFLLSCVPALKRLQPRENAIARMRIQKVLFQIEFDINRQNGHLSKGEVIDS